MMRRFSIFILVLAVLVCAVSPEAEARRRRRVRHRRAQIINEKKLFERLGGEKGLSAIIDEWMRINFADNRVSGSFAPITSKPERLAQLRRSVFDQLCEAAEGPCQVKASEAKKGLLALVQTDDQFLIVADNLVRSMQRQGVAEREKNEMLNRFGELRSDDTSDGKQ